MPTILENHISDLQKRKKLKVELIEAEGMKIVLIKDYFLPHGYTKTKSDLMIRLDSAYPNSKPDMFWLEEDILLSRGTIPKSSEGILESLGRKWRRFSWHLNNWNPATGDLLLYTEFINIRLKHVI